MKKEILFALANLLLIFSLATFGCSSDDSDHSNKDPLEMMQMLPEQMPNEEFAFIDLAAIRSGQSKALYAFVSRIMGYGPFGISPEMVNSYAKSDEVALFQGHFDFDSIRIMLIEYGYESTMCEGAELLESEHIDFDRDSYAFLDSFVIHGSSNDVRECILVMQKRQKSLYDNQDFKDIVTRLPQGTLIECDKNTFRYYYEYDGLQMAGTSMWAKNQDTISLEGILKFEDGDTAEVTMNRILTDLKDEPHSNWSNITTTLNGAYVKVTAEQPISAFIPIPIPIPQHPNVN